MFTPWAKKPNKSLILKNQPLSIWTVRQALIENKLIMDDGYSSSDIVDINSPTIWEIFRRIYEKHERTNVLNGHFSFYIEEYGFLSLMFKLNKKEFKVLIDSICSQFNCTATYYQEKYEEYPGIILNRVDVRHNFFSKDRNGLSLNTSGVKKAL